MEIRKIQTQMRYKHFFPMFILNIFQLCTANYAQFHKNCALFSVQVSTVHCKFGTIHCTLCTQPQGTAVLGTFFLLELAHFQRALGGRGNWLTQIQNFCLRKIFCLSLDILDIFSSQGKGGCQGHFNNV